MNSETQYIDLYGQCRSMLASHSAPVMNALREKAFDDFRAQGFPSRKVELYKYTDVAEAFSPNYGLNLNRLRIPVNPYEVFKCDVPNLSTALYFMVNDAFYDKELPKKPLPEGVIVCSLFEAATTYPDLVARHYGQLANTEKDAIVALNTMLVEDGLFIYVPKGITVDRTLQIVNILRADVDLMINRRVLIIAEESASVRLLFCDHAVDDRNFLATQVTEVFAGPNSQIEFYELEETHVKSHRFAHTVIHQDAYSRVTHNCLTLHNGLTRNTTRVALSGKGAEVNLFGGVIADKQQHVDNNTLIDHIAEGCQSNELYKYVLDEQSVGAFAGKVLVRPGAQKTVSQETNANLCTTREARMYSQPMLEIYADDVKCNHGSTVGQLNDAALFYMQQRGIPYDEARLLLEFAFMGEVLDTIHLESLRDRLHYLVEKRFRGELNKCEGCRLCQ
jgi:Fe-S cluster assembly protein SufD